MPENEDRDKVTFSSTVGDNHQWADQVAAGRQKQLKRFGLIVIVAIVAAVIAFSLF